MKSQLVIALLGRRDEPTDAVEDYCRYLAEALATHGMDLHVGSPLRKLFAQPMDINFDCVRSDLPRRSKNVVLDELFRDHAILPPHEQLKNRHLAGGEHLRPVVDEGLPALGVELDVRNLELAAEQLAGAPQQRFQPG